METSDRSKFIGGSDAAGVLGMSRWKTPLSVWAEKTGQYIEPEVESEAKELGKELEDYIARRFSRKTGKMVERLEDPSGRPRTLFDVQHSFLGATLDRQITGEGALLECKTASAWKSKEWEGDDIPSEYVIQCYHYMMVTGMRKAYLAVLIGNQDFKIKELAWDQKIIDNIREREVEFWNEFVIPKIMPTGAISYKDTEVLAGLFPVAQPEKIIELGDEANILVEQLTAAKQDAKTVENLIETLENQLKAVLGDAEAGSTNLYKVAWQNVTSRRFDAKAFEQSYPELAQKFKLAKTTRRFSYKPLKEEK